MRTKTVMLIIAATFTGCSNDGVDPQRPQAPVWELSSLPLAVGDEWTYDASFDVRATREDGTDAIPPRHQVASETRRIAAVDTLDGRVYAVESSSFVLDGESPVVSWRRLRQDQDAFYQADIAGVPPGEVPPDEEIDDQIRLQFPIAVGATWRLRPDSDGVVFTIEARETLALAIGSTPAWRVRTDLASARPADYSLVWYGSEGLLRSVTHKEFNAVDISTNEVVHLVTHEIVELVSLQIAP